MFSKEEIERLVQPIGNSLERYDVYDKMDLSYNSSMNIDKYYKQIPNVNPIYVEAIKHRNEVAVHAVKGTFPYDLLRTKSPNQSREEWEFQCGLVESYTLPSWGRAENKTKVIANEQNYSISGWNEDQRKYFFEDYPTYHSLLDYFFDIVRKNKGNFPNQVLLLKPYEIPYIKTDEGYFVDQTKEINYVADIVDEFHAVAFMDGKYLAVLCDEKVMLNDSWGHDREFYKFDFYDEENIWQVIPVRIEDNKVIYEAVLVLNHGWGRLPAQKLKGEIQDSIRGNVLYHSIFSFAIPKLNDAFRLSSNLAMSEYYAAFPVRVRVVDRCTHKDPTNNSPCSGGQIFMNGKYETCPKCQGTGDDASITPTGEIRVRMYSQAVGGEETKLPMTPPMTYISPDPAIFTHLATRIKDLESAAFASMWKSDVANNETATGKMLDHQEWYSVLVQFSNEFFSLLEFAIDGIGFYMFTKTKDRIGKDGSFVEPKISNPKFFDLRDAAEITAEISEARKNNMPEPYLLKLLEQYGSIRFNKKEQVDRFIKFWVYCERLWSKDDATVRTKVNSTCTPIESIVHDSLMSFIEQCEDDEPDFWDDEKFSNKERKELVFAKAQEVADKLIVAEPVPAADQMTEGSEEDEGGAIDPAEEAKSKLKGTVGGIEALLSIQESIAKGITSYEAGVQTLFEFYGFDSATAKQLLGPPPTQEEIDMANGLGKPIEQSE